MSFLTLVVSFISLDRDLSTLLIISRNQLLVSQIFSTFVFNLTDFCSFYYLSILLVSLNLLYMSSFLRRKLRLLV